MAGRSTDFWENIDFLKRQLSSLKQSSPPNLVTSKEHISASSKLRSDRSAMLVKIQQAIENITKSFQEGATPVVTMKRRNSWDNVRYTADKGLCMLQESPTTSIKFTNVKSPKRIAITLHMLEKILKLVETNTYCTKREIYYQDVKLFGSQKIVDSTVDDIACLLQVPRRELHILATSKGLIAGNLSFKDSEENYIDCESTANGVSVPTDVQGISYLRSAAKFILVVEKDATFQKLIDGGFVNEFKPCIMITGKGFPDLNTRELLKKLWETLEIPIFVLVDADPYGIEILCIYKFGSRSLSFDADNLVVSQVRWIGIHPSDIERLKIPDSGLIPLTKSDISKACNLLERPYICGNVSWKKQVEFLLKSQRKAEIQSLSSISADFLHHVYLPSKMRLGGWL